MCHHTNRKLKNIGAVFINHNYRSHLHRHFIILLKKWLNLHLRHRSINIDFTLGTIFFCLFLLCWNTSCCIKIIKLHQFSRYMGFNFCDLDLKRGRKRGKREGKPLIQKWRVHVFEFWNTYKSTTVLTSFFLCIIFLIHNPWDTL